MAAGTGAALSDAGGWGAGLVILRFIFRATLFDGFVFVKGSAAAEVVSGGNRSMEGAAIAGVFETASFATRGSETAAEFNVHPLGAGSSGSTNESTRQLSKVQRLRP